MDAKDGEKDKKKLRELRLVLESISTFHWDDWDASDVLLRIQTMAYEAIKDMKVRE